MVIGPSGCDTAVYSPVIRCNYARQTLARPAGSGAAACPPVIGLIRRAARAAGAYYPDRATALLPGPSRLVFTVECRVVEGALSGSVDPVVWQGVWNIHAIAQKHGP